MHCPYLPAGSTALLLVVLVPVLAAAQSSDLPRTAWGCAGSTGRVGLPLPDTDGAS